MIGPSGDGYFFLLWVILLGPIVLIWAWVIIKAGRLGARQGDRRRAENTVIDEPLRRIDPTKPRSLRDDD